MNKTKYDNNGHKIHVFAVNPEDPKGAHCLYWETHGEWYYESARIALQEYADLHGTIKRPNKIGFLPGYYQ